MASFSKPALLLCLLSLTSQSAAAPATPNTNTRHALVPRTDFHTRPAMDPSRFDFGDTRPETVMAELRKHCGDTTCDASFKMSSNYVRAGQMVEAADIVVSVGNAAFDGPDVGEGMIQGMIALSKYNFVESKPAYAAQCDGSLFGCTSGSIENFQGAAQYQINRFTTDTEQAGTMTVSFSKSSDGQCSDVMDLAKDVSGALGAIGPIGDLAGSFFGSVLDITCLAVSAASKDPPPGQSVGTSGYATGWCTFHVQQFQRPEGHNTDPYTLTVEIFDSKQISIGKATAQAANPTLNVDSLLPFVLTVTPTTDGSDEDARPVLFQYGDQSFGSNDQDHHCNFGKYDSGSRNGDCGFTC